ncbi:hypothetical protein FHX57_006446 [Paraburkholderia tropica]|uniref:DUF1173 family protein n=1 Tax=Paraburkholderia tropica TaxID=92647 RepID=UPI001616E71F|nr:DUF1173 family protein [Paraburkholderia tropica]MBB2984282.1 hypothetical protein [Paraburkholderia tropica]MBB3004067.1 hypothetical protein [Paraburkholderia tropica]
MPDVTFAGVRVALAEVQEHPARYARSLERAKVTPGYAFCHCRTDQPRQLVIRRYGSLFHLAGWPDDGVHHAPGCDFQKDPGRERPAAAGDSTAAIVEGHDGLNVRLDATLIQRDVVPGPRTPKTGTAPRTTRRRAPLLAFLQALWQTAGLTSWPGTSMARGWGAVNAMLLAGLGAQAKINGAPADEVLYVMRRYEESERETINAEFDAFLSRISNDGTVSHRALILGELGEVADTPYGKSITLRQRRQKYFSTTALVDHAAKTYAHAWRAIGDGSARVIAVLLVERTAKGHLRVVDLAAMLCSSTFLPCDSIHEVSMANRLVSARRIFEKPIHMGAADDMLPDFVLLDTRPTTHVEVYGMYGLASYERRKAEKLALRAARGIPAVEWNVDRELLEHIALPPVSARA